ncbi:MAG: ribosome assembly cofactor RimP [Flavobacteriaceae bacterium]|nr:ribosome assembly cofactor RimP [Flavobacteriaceae bacterium]|tara:strand:- start:51 stop:515 length:465 start_codon:yes stop_codon:yes gene_type:complete
MKFEEKFRDILSEVLKNYKSIFLIDLTFNANNDVKVFLDGDNGVTLKDCASINSEIKKNLDQDEINYSIEIGSCGIDYPLKLVRQFKKNISRKIEITDFDDRKYSGVLAKVSNSSFEINWKERQPKKTGKGKVTVDLSKNFNYGEYKKAQVILN